MNASGNPMLELAKDPGLQDALAADRARIPPIVYDTIR